MRVLRQGRITKRTTAGENVDGLRDKAQQRVAVVVYFGGCWGECGEDGGCW